jgi:formate hydrogenlyase subunit 3/multisubunit Na+/H+ antiporter MnhD subunit
MVINTIAYLVGVCLVGFLRVRMRWDRILAWLMFFVTLFLFCNYGIQAMDGSLSAFSFVWNDAKIGKITIDYFPTIATNRLLVPLFFMALMTILYNNIFRYEERRTLFNSLIILNFVSLCLLVCANNYVQLITAVFVSDVIGYMVLKDVDSSRRYVIFNFLADMLLFMILAMVVGRIQSIEISQLFTYKQIGAHKDFVGIITAIALFIKMGVFPFHSYLLDISNARFQRMSAINLMFCPMLGVLLLLKLHNLLIISDLFYPIYKIVGYITFFTGLLFFILKNDFRKKVIYFNMANIGALMLLLQTNLFEWNNFFAYYYVCIFFYNILFFKIYLYQNRENDISNMINTKEINKEPMIANFIMLVLLTNLFCLLMYKMSILLDKYLPICIGGSIVISVAIMLNHIYRSPNTRRLNYLNKNPLRILSFIINLLLLIFVTYHFSAYKTANIVCVILFVILCLVPGFGFLRKAYENNIIQKHNLSYTVYYYLIVYPVMHISRMLWLIVDMVFSEKIIKPYISKLNRASISLFFKFNKKSYVMSFIYLLAGILIFILSFYRNGLP